MPTAAMHVEDPVGTAFRVLLVVGFVVAAWYGLSARPVFVIRFTAAGTTVAKGSPTSQCVSALEALRQDCRLTKGRVVGTVAEGKRIRVVASSNLAWPPRG